MYSMTLLNNLFDPFCQWIHSFLPPGKMVKFSPAPPPRKNWAQKHVFWESKKITVIFKAKTFPAPPPGQNRPFFLGGGAGSMDSLFLWKIKFNVNDSTHRMLSKVYRFFFGARFLVPTYLFWEKHSVFFFIPVGKRRRKKIRTLKNATTKKGRKRTKKEIRFSFSIPKFICIFKKNDLSFLKWPVSEKIASEQPNFDTQIHWQVFIIWACRFFSIPAGGKTEKKKQNPENRSNFFWTFFFIFFCFFFPRNEKKKRGNFPIYFFLSQNQEIRIWRRKKNGIPLMLSVFFFSFSHFKKT